MRPNFNLMRATLTGALGGLLFGFDTVVIAGAIDALVRLYSLSPNEKGFTVAIGLVGTVIGALAAGQIGQRLGSREALRITAVLYLLSAIGCGLAWDWSSFLIFRFIGGLGIGASSVLGPVYIAELAPAKWRGRLVATFQFQHRLRRHGRLHLQLPLPHAASGRDRVAFGRSASRRISSDRIPRASLRNSPAARAGPLPATAIDEALSVTQAHGATPILRPSSPTSAPHSLKSTPQPHEHVFRWKYRFSALPCHLHRRFQPVRRHQRNPLLHQQHLRILPVSAQTQAYAQATIIGATNFVFTFVGMALSTSSAGKALPPHRSRRCSTCLAGVARHLSHSGPSGNTFAAPRRLHRFFSISQGAVIWVYSAKSSPRCPFQRAGNRQRQPLVHCHLIALLFLSSSIRMSPETPFVFFAVMTVVQFCVVLFVYPNQWPKTLEAVAATASQGRLRDDSRPPHPNPRPRDPIPHPATRASL